MRKRTVHVTQRDIDAGRRGACRLCPIALALNRDHSDAGEWGAGAGQCWAYVFTDAGDLFPREMYLLPKAARAFVAEFDQAREVQPFSFEIVEEL